jgi:hypothetical protein
VTAAPSEPLPVRRPPVPIALLVLGLLIFAFGMIIQAPVAPIAVWSGIVDSSRASGSAAIGPFGLRRPTAAVSVSLRRVPQVRTLRLPPASAFLSESLRTGDTLRAVLGWGLFDEDTASALQIWRNGTVLLDSAVVLGAQRRLRSRTALLGAVLALAGGIGLARHHRAIQAH